MTTKKYKVSKEGRINFDFYQDFEKEFHQNHTLIGFRETITGALGRQDKRFSHIYDVDNTAMILIKRYDEPKRENLILIGEEKNFKCIEEMILNKFELKELR